MGYRKFTDRDGNVWEIRARSHAEWTFEPMPGSPGRSQAVPAPGYEKDPFELSVEELQGMLDAVQEKAARSKRSPFRE